MSERIWHLWHNHDPEAEAEASLIAEAEYVVRQSADMQALLAAEAIVAAAADDIRFWDDHIDGQPTGD